MKQNTLAEQLTGIALRQLIQAYTFKLPRINQIRKYRDLYNGKSQRQLRVRYNVPIPIFSGMIDTLNADLDDDIILKYEESDPADWKAAIKANAVLKKEMISRRPGACWNEKFRGARNDCVMTGRGTMKMIASNEDGFNVELDDVAFEDFFFEPKGGRNLENHLFCGQSNIKKKKKELEDEAGGLYDAVQVKNLTDFSGNQYKQSSYWDNYDYANRFMSLNLASEANNYVGEDMFNLVEWVLSYKGQRWYLLFEAFNGTWIRFEKLTDIYSSGYYPWMSFASHPDKKNFASKGFADDLYPCAVAATDLFNEDLENKKRRNSNAKAFDKDMFPNVAQLDEAQIGRDRLVSVDTKGGTRRIADGIYAFQTPELIGTIDTINWIENIAGRNFGVTDMQQGDVQDKNKKVGVAYAELSQASKRLSFTSQPIIEVGQDVGMRFFGALKDYLREPMAIKILGEEGYEWDTLKRIDLNVKKDFEISITSQSKENKMNELAKQNRLNALESIRNTPPQNPNINSKMADEYILRDVGGYSEAEIALMLDPNSNADKRTIAETSEAIQSLMVGKIPPLNYNATAYFLQKILDFVKTHQADAKIKKNYQKFLDYINQHIQIAAENEARRAKKDALATGGGQMPSSMPTSPNLPIPANNQGNNSINPPIPANPMQ